jgi:hypothetical protein
MAAPMTQYEWETLGEAEAAHEQAHEWETESETGELFLGDVANWARRQWTAVQTPGSWQRRAALAAARSALPAAGKWAGGKVGGWIGPDAADLGSIAGNALGSAGVSLLPDREWEAELETEFEAGFAGEGEWEAQHELNPVRKVYLDAMLEHMAHESAHAETEDEAVEGFLPLIPLLAGKLLPLAAKVLPKLAGKLIPRLARAVTRVSPQLSRGVSNLTRTLYRDPRTRNLVRAVPSIAQRTMLRVARQAAAGRPLSPQAAQRVLAQQTYRVLTRPAATQLALRRNVGMDRQYHGSTGVPMQAPAAQGVVHCPACGAARAVRLPSVPQSAASAGGLGGRLMRPAGGRWRCGCCPCSCGCAR